MIASVLACCDACRITACIGWQDNEGRTFDDQGQEFISNHAACRVRYQLNAWANDDHAWHYRTAEDSASNGNKSMTTEQYIRDAASRGWSKTQTLEALGLCRTTFYAMLEAMPPLEWPAQGKSMGHRLANESRRGNFTTALRVSLERGRAIKKDLHSHTIDGVRGTIEELAAHYGMHASTVRRRMKFMSLEDALKTPVIPAALRRNGYVTRGNSARASA